MYASVNLTHRLRRLIKKGSQQNRAKNRETGKGQQDFTGALKIE